MTPISLTPSPTTSLRYVAALQLACLLGFLAGPTRVAAQLLPHFMEYKASESSKKAEGGVLAPGCVVTLDDPLFDFADGASSAENYEISKTASLGLPADKNEEGLVDLAGTHLLGLKAKAAKQGALPVADGQFPKGRKHAKRQGVELTIANPTFHDGSSTNTIRVDTKKVTRVLVPANKDLSSVPDNPAGGTAHYKCYKAVASKTAPFGTLQDSKGKELKNLQVVVEDQFADGGGHETYGAARLFDLKKVTEVCNPVAKETVDQVEQDRRGATRTTTCDVTPASVVAPSTSLVCWRATVAKKEFAQPWDGVEKGAAIRPKQGKHSKRRLKDENPLYVGHQFGAPDRLDSLAELHFCFPAEVTDLGVVPALCPREPSAEICDSALDEDCDGSVDCDDTADCASDPACKVPVCGDGIVDPGEECDDPLNECCAACVFATVATACDADGNECTLSKCDGVGGCVSQGTDGDSCTGNGVDACSAADTCLAGVCQDNGPNAEPEVCDNGGDEDCDGDVDCADSDCSSDPACGPAFGSRIVCTCFCSGCCFVQRTTCTPCTQPTAVGVCTTFCASLGCGVNPPNSTCFLNDDTCPAP